ncbi:MAG TPA: hypothetical protein VMU84_11150 [Thermoanaerobaculia bacterium]|nr:hypothetical protein [Thermoanaerobaculia bacterium]
MFVLLAIVKGVGLAVVLRRPIPRVIAVWLIVGIVLSLFLAIALMRRVAWARTFATIYAAAHAVAILLMPLVGIGVLVSGVVGIAALSILVREV